MLALVLVETESRQRVDVNSPSDQPGCGPGGHDLEPGALVLEALAFSVHASGSPSVGYSSVEKYNR
jgi:hypothetical protein